MTGLFSAIKRSWDRDTSADPENWTEENPAYGQCAVTALVIQDYLGGRLLRTKVGGVSHYFNSIPDVGCIDLTWQQFPRDAEQEEDVHERSREYVLSYPDTQLRYARLLARVDNLWPPRRTA